MSYLYLGKYYNSKVLLTEGSKDYAELKDGMIHIYVREVSDNIICKTVQRFYYQNCKKIINSRVRYYQGYFKTRPRAIEINNNISNWGSCDSLYKLTFNWKLVMAPIEVIDYVVVHELSHMVHLNHDRSFWRLVGKYVPNYKEKEDWLKYNAHRMKI